MPVADVTPMMQTETAVSAGVSYWESDLEIKGYAY